jgi:hypothetical protein
MRVKILGCVALLSMVVGLVLAAPPCTVPNPNTVGCTTTPPDWVASCIGVNLANCTSSAQYIINLFPNGYVEDPASTKYTTQDSADCYKTAACAINTNFTPNVCQNMNGYSGWYLAPKTIPGANCTGG